MGKKEKGKTTKRKKKMKEKRQVNDEANLEKVRKGDMGRKRKGTRKR